MRDYHPRGKRGLVGADAIFFFALIALLTYFVLFLVFLLDIVSSRTVLGLEFFSFCGAATLQGHTRGLVRSHAVRYCRGVGTLAEPNTAQVEHEQQNKITSTKYGLRLIEFWYNGST